MTRVDLIFIAVCRSFFPPSPACVLWHHHTRKNNRFPFNPTSLPRCHLLRLADSRSDPAAPSKTAPPRVYGGSQSLTSPLCLWPNLSMSLQLFPAVTPAHPLTQYCLEPTVGPSLQLSSTPVCLEGCWWATPLATVRRTAHGVEPRRTALVNAPRSMRRRAFVQGCVFVSACFTKQHSSRRAHTEMWLKKKKKERKKYYSGIIKNLFGLRAVYPARDTN